jgi:glycosyltransferase involved in cell wall biosynthesis
MKFAVLSTHLPEREGPAAGRALRAACEGLLAEGHEVSVRSFREEPPTEEIPPWCVWRPLPAVPRLRLRLTSLARPRSEAVRSGWRPPPDAITVADDPFAFPAVAGAERPVLTVHFLTALDAPALGRRSLPDVQDRRAEARAARQAKLILVYSPRVGRALPRPSSYIPIAYPMPAQALAPVEEPVAGLLADWRWPPNRWVLSRLLAMWPTVREAVPDARLLLAGRGLHDDVGELPGVQALGPLRRSAELLDRVALIAFPCPDTSGPKVKVLEALSHGLPVVTTPAGVEGLLLPPGTGAVITGLEGFPAALADLLASPQRRAELGRSGREAMLAGHAPVAAARARVAAVAAAFGPDRRERRPA